LQASVSFIALVSDLSRHLGIGMTPDEDESSVAFGFDDGLELHLFDCGDGGVAIVVDTRVDLRQTPATSVSQVLELMLQINFATLLSSRITVAQSPNKTIVLTYAEPGGRNADMDGQQLLQTLDFVLSKGRNLRELIREILISATAGDTPDLNRDLADHFNQRA
jgi:hypothetical protein